MEGEKRENEKVSSKQIHFVLVHGASHGSWCWYKVRSLLESLEYKVTCIDLKACGIDLTQPSAVSSWEDFNLPLINFFTSLPLNEKVILVGHSFGGLSITYATYKFFNKIHMTIYVVAEMTKHLFNPNQVVSTVWLEVENKKNGTLETGLADPKTFYNMSPIEDYTLALMLLRPLPWGAIKGINFDDDDVDIDSIPRVYIKTMHDLRISAEDQDKLIEAWPPSQVYVLESDHSPFFSTPTQLFAFLVKSASSINFD